MTSADVSHKCVDMHEMRYERKKETSRHSPTNLVWTPNLHQLVDGKMPLRSTTVIPCAGQAF